MSRKTAFERCRGCQLLNLVCWPVPSERCPSLLLMGTSHRGAGGETLCKALSDQFFRSDSPVASRRGAPTAIYIPKGTLLQQSSQVFSINFYLRYKFNV